MDSERWGRIQEVFGDALERAPGADRETFLDGACGDDHELRTEVDSLLRAAGEADAYFDDLQDRAGITQDLTATGPGREAALDFEGRRVGAYRLGSLLGRGGMGAVYLAERADGQFELRAALKLLAVGAATETAHRRFLEERRILARLEHPGIARLLDGGVTEDGTPYFVMEHVVGRPIMRYARDRALDVEARLDLFLQVCDAVSYAHRKLVVHRDLKPSNILVTDSGRVKLLDFGIARLTEEDTGDPLTEAGHRLMTPRYASPEQLRGEPVTTSSDVYQLGLLLYELLTGVTPYAPAEDRASLVEAVVNEPVTAPSSIVLRGGHAGDHPTAAAALGGTPQSLARRLRGDLDNIIVTALRKEPERRYGSVDALSDDVRRHLDGYPVKAAPESVGYLVSRFLKRHRGPVAAAAVLVLLLTTLAVMSVRFAVTTGRQAELIARERDKAEETAHFLRELFEIANPALSDGETVTARELLDRGAGKIRTDHADEPELQAEMMTVLGTVYHHLDLPQPAVELLQESRRLQQRFPERVPEANKAETLHQLGLALRDAGEPQAAVAVLREARSRLERLYGPDDRTVALATFGLARSLHLANDFEGAEREFESATARFADLAIEPDDELAEGLFLLAEYKLVRGDTAGVEGLYRRSIDIRESLYGPASHPDVPLTIRGLAALESRRGRFDRATGLYREALALDQRLFADADGEDHPSLAQAYYQLGGHLAEHGDADEAEELLRTAMQLYDGSARAQPDMHAQAVGSLARLVRRRGRGAEALALYGRAVDILGTVYGQGSLVGASLDLDRADLLVEMGRGAEAAPLLRSTLTAYEGVLAPDHPRVRRARELLQQVGTAG